MSYSTYTSILPIIPGLPQTSTAGGWSTTVQVIGSHITRADSIIDAKCANRYAVPFSITPAVIITLSEDIVSYYTFRSFYTQDNQNYNEYIERYEMAFEMLDEIRKGKMDLVEATGVKAEADVIDHINSNTETYQPFFDIDSSFDWGFDDDRVDGVSDARD